VSGAARAITSRAASIDPGNTGAPTRWLIDNSAWQRLRTEPTVQAALEALVLGNAPDDILICPPVAAEYGYSARSAAEHDVVVHTLASAFTACEVHPPLDDVLALQSALFRRGTGRAAGAIDLLIAAYALRNGATVVHYDRDFELIARARPDFAHRWVVPAGSL